MQQKIDEKNEMTKENRYVPNSVRKKLTGKNTLSHKQVSRFRELGKVACSALGSKKKYVFFLKVPSAWFY